ncbi:MAG: DNA-formamidopyrimidine glycosylase family protein [Acidimicrobiia bacterium]|nr:DNA-formamidopyrimidine glycosylase family protein [Acidimicrobiia bacterium]
MPELPEIEAYLAALRPRVEGATLEQVRVSSFSLLKTFDPPLEATHGASVVGLHRIGKRVSIDLSNELHLVIHLMVAGRFQWNDQPKPVPRRGGLAAFDFDTGSLQLTEAGTKRRASLSVITTDDLSAVDPGGIEVADASIAEFREALLAGRHTLKRALTDARHISGIGGAFGDEILHAAKLSPTQMNTNLSDEELERLFDASKSVLDQWTRIRIEETGDGFPTKVTAFHPDMAVHGKYGEPCPVCEAPIQRIVAGGRETNYCPGCQTEGRILADRSLSRLLKDDWPRHLDEL